MEIKDGRPAIHMTTRQEWRDWLATHSATHTGLWLIIYHKKSAVPCIPYEATVEEALCYGWIDSKTKKRDHESYYRTFSPRKPRSQWSPINRERADRLICEGLMTPQGQAVIDLARQSGSWEPETGVSPGA